MIEIYSITRQQSQAKLDRDTQREKRYVRVVVACAVLVFALAMSLVAGCAGTGSKLTPQFVQDTVSDTVQLGTSIFPDSIPDVRKATTVVCAAASTTTNLARIDPRKLVEDMTAAGVQNQNAKNIVNGVVVIWNRTWAYIQPEGLTNLTQVSAYANALCSGMQSGLPPAGQPGALMATRKTDIPHLK